MSQNCCVWSNQEKGYEHKHCATVWVWVLRGNICFQCSLIFLSIMDSRRTLQLPVLVTKMIKLSSWVYPVKLIMCWWKILTDHRLISYHILKRFRPPLYCEYASSDMLCGDYSISPAPLQSKESVNSELELSIDSIQTLREEQLLCRMEQSLDVIPEPQHKN